jgi:hypothetical protein
VLFGGNSGATAGDTNVPTGTSPPTTGGTGSGSGTTTPTNNAALQQALLQARQALTDRTNALKAGDWTAYGLADARLSKAIADALAAEGSTGK